MATLEELSAFKEGDPHTETVRQNLKEAMKARRWELIAKQADIAGLSTPTDPDAENHDQLEAQRIGQVEARQYELQNIFATYNALEAQLAAMPPDKVAAAAKRRERALGK